MSGWRHPSQGAWIDRATPLSFTFDGQRIDGFEGETLASALLASGTRVLGRSFKYHRARGLWGMGADEPNAIFDVRLGDRHMPNQRATTTLARNGMTVTSVNARPTAARDRFGLLDRFHAVLPAGFYYKTFMALNWMRYEPMIRRMAGLGQVDPAWHPPADAPQVTARCDLLIVGAGPAGLAAAEAATAAGRTVWLVDDGVHVGGSLQRRGGQINGRPWADWADDIVASVRSGGGRILLETTLWGVFDHGMYAGWIRSADGPDTHLRLRAQDVVVATGAIERPLWFANNDVPGVMSCEAALHHLICFGAVAGRDIVIATANGSSYPVALALREAGAQVTLVDQRDETDDLDGIAQIRGEKLTAAVGRRAVTGAVVNGKTIPCDAILCSGGYTPTVHLWCQAGGKLDWDEARDVLVPRPGTAAMTVAGAANGHFGLHAALEDGARLFGGPVPSAPDAPAPDGHIPVRPDPKLPGRQWIDLQNDVTLKDVGLAAREGYTSVEHLKRYTTLGMANDQGRTSNFAGLAAMAAVTGRSIPETGTTTYRPPFEPVPLAVIAGRRRGALFNPLKRLTLEAQHRAAGARFREYGGWLRPSVYGAGPEQDRAQAEALTARQTAVVFDASPLGKLEVLGPGAAALLDFTGYMRMSTLHTGRARYGFMLSEGGILYDDGVVLRLAQDRFIVSASSSHVDGVRFRLEDARQDRIGHSKVVIQDTTQSLVTLTVSGPRALEVVRRVGIASEALAHMDVAELPWEGHRVRVARISFTGDRSYEISVPAQHAEVLAQRLSEAVTSVGGCWAGLEAIMILRAEKGYILVGKDTDGNTMPQDLGWAGPRSGRSDEYLGKRALFTPAARADNRRHLVGLQVVDAGQPFVTGGHLVPLSGPRRSLGFVTSSYASPVLDRPIALALMERGQSSIGTQVGVFHDGDVRTATVTSACAFDPEGRRLDG